MGVDLVPRYSGSYLSGARDLALNQSSTDKPWLASLKLGFVAIGPKSVLVHNRHQGPLVVQKALYPEGPGVCHAVVLHPPAGVAEGDNLSIEVGVGENAHAVIATPSATRWYKSARSYALQEVSLSIAAGGRLEWLPQENLFFENARASQTLTIRAEPGARMIAWDAYMLGRTAHGEAWQGGTVRLASELHVGRHMVFAERGEIEGSDVALDGGPGLAGMRCGATLWALGDEALAGFVEELAPSLPYHANLMAGASMPESGLMVVRALGREVGAVRALLQKIWASVRPVALGVSAQPLRLWAC